MLAAVVAEKFLLLHLHQGSTSPSLGCEQIHEISTTISLQSLEVKAEP
jgi:hypothetical protein